MQLKPLELLWKGNTAVKLGKINRLWEPLNWGWVSLSLNLVSPSLDSKTTWNLEVCNRSRQKMLQEKPFLSCPGGKKMAYEGTKRLEKILWGFFPPLFGPASGQCYTGIEATIAEQMPKTQREGNPSFWLEEQWIQEYKRNPCSFFSLTSLYLVQVVDNFRKYIADQEN